MKVIRSAILFFVLFTFYNVKAQEETYSAFRYGARVGAVVSTFSNQQPYTSVKMGLTVGAVVEYRLNDKMFIQAEPGYLQQGGTYLRFSDDSRFGTGTAISDLYTTENRVTLHNIDVPIMFKYSLPSLGEFHPNVMLGPALGFMIDARNSYTRTYYVDQTFITVDGYQGLGSEYEFLQLGATAGIGGDVNIGGKRLLLDFRYRYGITPSKKSYSYIDLYSVQGDLSTHSFYFTIGIGL